MKQSPIYLLVLVAALFFAVTGYADHHEAAEASTTGANSSLSDTVKRAGSKGASTGADTLMGGATVEDSAKKGGAAAVDEALRPSSASTPETPAPVSAPPVEAAE